MVLLTQSYRKQYTQRTQEKTLPHTKSLQIRGLGHRRLLVLDLKLPEVYCEMVHLKNQLSRV